MQPHSMAALGLANQVWNEGIYLASLRMQIRYKSPNGEHLYYYDLKSIEYSRGQFSASIGRSGGGQACVITAKIDHHERVEMTHQTQHVAGLIEKYKLTKERIENGEHHNSKKYGRFWGKIKTGGRIELDCEVRTSKGNFVTLPYVLAIDSMILKNTFPKF